MSRAAVSLGIGLAAVLVTAKATAYCPSYTLSSAYNTHNCGVEAVQGTNPTVAEWNDIFDLVAQGPAAWGTAGPSISDIKQGCGNPEAEHDVPPLFPCELLKAIAMAESSWTQFCEPDEPADQVGPPVRTIISFDCGYGVGQVTSGMHIGDSPSFDPQRVAQDPTYNMATGAQIYATKWRATQCVGDRQPNIIEHWYTATWAYNGLAWSNNPNNPNHDPARDVYDPAIGGSYAYQEKVFGRVEHSPGAEYWNGVPLAYPDRAECGSDGSPPALSEPHCATPTDCTNTRTTHQSACFGGPPVDGGAGGMAADADTDAPASDSAVGGAGGAPTSDGSAAGMGGVGGVGAQQGATTYTGSEDEGCSCRVPSGRGRPRGLILFFLMALAVRSRRRR